MADKLDQDEIKPTEEITADSQPKQQGRLKRLGRWLRKPKVWGSIVGVVVIILVALGAIPLTRYTIIGLFYRSNLTVVVLESKSHTPVTSALVSIDGQTSQTDNRGIAAIKAHPGRRQLAITKSYYSSVSQAELVPSGHQTYTISMTALGQPVQVKIINKITGKSVSGVAIDANGATAKSDASGLATLVLDSNATTVNAKFVAAGYNNTTANVTAGGQLAKNTFSLVPSGKLYFLSNLSGKIDVVKTNLDGSNRQTVLAGTGNEDPTATTLLASRDWKYLALEAKRGDHTQIYLIDTTSNDKLSTVDQTNGIYGLVGWSNHTFVYNVTSSGGDWRSSQLIKSVNADTGQAATLDQTQVSGNDSNNYAAQYFGSIYVMDSKIVYAKNWSSTGEGQLTGKQAELDTVNADGSSQKMLKGFAPVDLTNVYTIAISTTPYEPGGLYIRFDGDTVSSYFKYDDGQVTADNTLNQTSFSNPYATYLESPDGSKTFWSEQRDGKNSLFVGDADGKNQNQIASLSDYSTYGWYSNDYLLVSKNGSELYILPVSGGTPLKMTDYFKSFAYIPGYGSGYGAL